MIKNGDVFKLQKFKVDKNEKILCSIIGYIKKKLIIVSLFLVLSACNGNNYSQDDINTYNSTSENQFHETETDIVTSLPEPIKELTLEELANKIVTVGTFWTDLWYFTGIFAVGEHVDFSYPAPPFEIIMNGVRVLPSSGFTSLNDIENFLLSFYTQDRVSEILSLELTNSIPFVEYNENLFTNGTRAGFPMPYWERATHELLEHINGHAVVKTTVPHGTWHMSNIDEIEYGHAIYIFVFENGRISIEEQMQYWFLSY